MTIIERINAYQSEIIRGNLLPVRAAEILTEISALIGNINEEITKRDMEYNMVLMAELDNQKSANRAKIKAGTYPEYEHMRNARNAKEVAIEMIRSLKYFLKAKEEEYGVSKYQ